jgi:hypothetical protein
LVSLLLFLFHVKPADKVTNNKREGGRKEGREGGRICEYTYTNTKKT